MKTIVNHTFSNGAKELFVTLDWIPNIYWVLLPTITFYGGEDVSIGFHWLAFSSYIRIVRTDKEPDAA